MIPPTIRRQLSTLRSRERILQLAWGLSRWLALVLAVIVGACLLDYLIDRYRETPFELRVGLFVGLFVAGLVGVILFLLLPLRRRLDDERLALWVEEKNPELRHRLISAVQLNRQGAFTEGMSKELIAVVTSEAEQQTRDLPFAAVADHDRVRKSALVAGPALLVFALPLILLPELSGILLARLFLADRDIPRRVTVANETREVWPAGEKVTLTVRASGLRAEDTGELVVYQDGVSDRYPLERKQPASGEDVYTVELPAGSADFTFQAYIGDGKLPRTAQVRYEPRPMVIKQQAWVILPSYCVASPAGQPYQLAQARGEVAGIKESLVRVRAKIQKPVSWVKVEILGHDRPVPDDGDRSHGEKLLQTLPAKVLQASELHEDEKADDGTWVEAVFDLRPEQTGYRIVAEDKYGFRNQPPPRRSLRVIPEEPPVVTLLREQFPGEEDGNGKEDDAEFEGLPIPVGGKLPVGYTFSGQYGVGCARFMYRVLKKTESGNDAAADAKWTPISLKETEEGKGTGYFDLRKGAFANSPDTADIFFHAVPAVRRTLGGGRFVYFSSKMVPDVKGFKGVKEGDLIEYYIEVFAGPTPADGRPSARTETRVKNVVTGEELRTWLRDTINEERRVRALNTGQQEVLPKRK